MAETSAGNGVLTDVVIAGDFWITPTGGIVTPNAPPNIASITGSANAAKIRCVGIGLRITYEGTELNRSGRYIVGQLRPSFPANGVAATGTKLSLLSTVSGGPTSSITALKQSMENCWESRNCDGTLETHWVPDGVPTYQMATNDGAVGSVFTTAAGAAVTPSGWNSPDGGFGVESGQNMLCVIVDNDTTPTAVATSNLYAIDIIWHWEVCPNDPTAVAYEVSDSPANTALVDKSLNLINKFPSARFVSATAPGF
jgi:hypothetical protein